MAAKLRAVPDPTPSSEQPWHPQEGEPWELWARFARWLATRNREAPSEDDAELALDWLWVERAAAFDAQHVPLSSVAEHFGRLADLTLTLSVRIAEQAMLDFLAGKREYSMGEAMRLQEDAQKMHETQGALRDFAQKKKLDFDALTLEQVKEFEHLAGKLGLISS